MSRSNFYFNPLTGGYISTDVEIPKEQRFYQIGDRLYDLCIKKSKINHQDWISWFDPNDFKARQKNNPETLKEIEELIMEWKEILETIWTPLLSEPLLTRGTP